jgi:hypothetical protein
MKMLAGAAAVVVSVMDLPAKAAAQSVRYDRFRSP